jgi:hypothetical protein
MDVRVRLRPRTYRSASLAGFDGAVIGSALRLGYAHAPGVEDKLAHLGLIDLIEPDSDPVVAKVLISWHVEFVRFGRDQRGALLLRKAEPHGLLVR